MDIECKSCDSQSLARIPVLFALFVLFAELRFLKSGSFSQPSRNKQQSRINIREINTLKTNQHIQITASRHPKNERLRILEGLLFAIRLIDGITKKGPLGVLAVYSNRGWQDSSQGTSAKSDGKLENPSRKLKEHEGNYKLKPDNRTLFVHKEKKIVLLPTEYLLKMS